MTTIGWVLIAIGTMEPVMGYLVVAPRIPNEGQRRLVSMAMATSGVLMVGLGIAFLTGILEGAASV